MGGGANEACVALCRLARVCASAGEASPVGRTGEGRPQAQQQAKCLRFEHLCLWHIVLGYFFLCWEVYGPVVCGPGELDAKL